MKYIIFDFGKVLGYPKTKGVTIGFLHTEPHTG